MSQVAINVRYVTRVEGHGHIKVNVNNGHLEEVKFEITESPRFFEAMLKGRRWDEVAHITSRICGICSVGHTITSLRATEAAMGVEPSEQTVLLRKLITHGATIQSHILHVYFLVAPDLLGVGSVIPLAASHPDVVKRALALKKLGNDLSTLVGGRTTHPVTLVVNGVTHLPSRAELKEMRGRLVGARSDLATTVDLLSGLQIPEFHRPTEYLSLQHSEEYAFYDGIIRSSAGWTAPVAEYRNHIFESVVPHSTTKHVAATGPSVAVGALARFNNNHDQLRPEAKEAARKLGLVAPCYNPFMNSVAQIVEVVHCVEESIDIIDELLRRGLREEDRRFPVRAGRGVGANEVPRGTLYHEYIYDSHGRIESANLIIPTNQNVANIEYDMRALVPNILDRPKEEIAHTLEMLVRSYDPCISCATHLLEVEFV